MEKVLDFASRHKRTALGVLGAVLGLAWLGVLEWKSASFAYATRDGDAAVQYAAMSVILGLTGFVAIVVAGLFAEDIRPQVRRRVAGARLLAAIAMIVPIANLATSFSYDKAMQDWRAYMASPAYALDVETAKASAMEVGIDAKRDAAAQLIKPTPNTVFDPLSWMTAILLHVGAILAGGALRVPAKATDREIANVKAAQQRARKRAAAQKRAKIQAKAKSPANVLPFGKRA